MKLRLPSPIFVLLKVAFFITIAVIYFSILLSYPEKSNLGVLVTNFVIVVYAIYRAFFSQRYNYSIYQFFYVFVLLFMGMAPLVQYKQSVETVAGYDISDNTYLLTNVILIAVFILIDIIYGYRHKKAKDVNLEENKFTTKRRQIKDTLRLRLLLIMLSSVSLAYVLYINQQDLTGLFYRDIFIERVQIEDSMVSILTGILRPLSVFAFIFYYKVGRSKPLKLALFIIATITCFPLALTRFLIGAYWIPILITIFRSLNRKKVLGYAYTLGLLILFPMFEIFRALSVYVYRGEILNEFSNKVAEAFSSISYDSFQSLAFVIQNNFVTSGQQLFGVLGLFIPRAIWESKPIGSGFTVSNEYNLGWDNISMNFFGEGYVNYGIVGVFIFATILALVMRYLDSRYWLRMSSHGQLFPVIYLIILGIFAYIMRGDMMGSFTSTIGVILSATLVYGISVVFQRARK